MHIRDAILNDIFGERISENISIDSNGQLICANCVLARTGYYDYLESELFDGGSDTKVIKVYRSPEEVFAPESIRSMNFKPLVDDHPEDNVTPDSVNSLSKGFMANVRRGEGEYSESLMGDLVVTDPEVIELIQTKNKRDLSVGYTCDIEEKDGKYFMKNIRGNHIALCKAGRAGNARIRDSRAVDAKPLDREGNVLSVGTKVFIYRGGNNEGKVGTVKSIKNVSEYGSDFEVEYNGIVTKHSSEDLIKDSKVVEDSVRGSFANLGELVSRFNDSVVRVDSNKVFVDFAGSELEYKALDGVDGRLVLVKDSSVVDRKGVDEVYSKFVDERDAVYKGLELTGAEDEYSTKHVVKNGAFDTDKATGYSEAGEFKFEANDADDYAETQAGKLVKAAMKELGITSRKDLLSREKEVVRKMKSFSSGYGDMQLKWFVENYAEMELKDCDMNEDYSDSFKDKYADGLLQVENALSVFGFSYYGKTAGGFQEWKFRYNNYSDFINAVDRLRSIYPNFVVSSSAEGGPNLIITLDFEKVVRDSAYESFADEDTDDAIYKNIELTGSQSAKDSKSYRVRVGGRTFDTAATSPTEAIKKVKGVLADAGSTYEDLSERVATEVDNEVGLRSVIKEAKTALTIGKITKEQANNIINRAENQIAKIDSWYFQDAEGGNSEVDSIVHRLIESKNAVSEADVLRRYQGFGYKYDNIVKALKIFAQRYPSFVKDVKSIRPDEVLKIDILSGKAVIKIGNTYSIATGVKGNNTTNLTWSNITKSSSDLRSLLGTDGKIKEKNDAFSPQVAAEEFKLSFKRGDKFVTKQGTTLTVVSVTPDGVRTKREVDGFIQFWKTADFYMAFSVMGSATRIGDAALSPANIKLSNGSVVNFYGWADKNGYGTSYYSVGEKTRGGFVFHAHFETESLAKRFLSSFNNPSAVVVRSAIGVTKSAVVDSRNRMFKVCVGDKEYGVRAYDHTDAVRKVRDSQRYIVYAPDTYNGRTALCYKRQGKAQYSEFSRADRFSKEEAERIEGFKGGYSWEKRPVEY